MQFTTTEKAAILQKLTQVARAVSGRPLRLAEEEIEGELGHTSKDNVIYISLDHPYFAGLTKPEMYLLVRGLFSHELLHQLITNFLLYTQAIKDHERFEQKVFSSILNVCEDGAIEYFSPNYLSDDYVRSLEFCRSVVYKNSEALNEGDNLSKPFVQFFSAVLHFRFFGFLKGEFTFPEAKEAFVKCMDPLNRAFENPTQKGRIDCAEEILETSRPLWEKDAKEQEELRKLLEELMKHFSMPENNGSGRGTDSSEKPADDSSGLSVRRRITVREVSKEEYEEAKKNTDKSGSGMPGGDIEVLVCKDAEPEKDDSSETSGASTPAGDGKGDDKDDDSSSESGSGKGDKKDEKDDKKGGSKGDKSDGDKADGKEKTDAKDSAGKSDGDSAKDKPENGDAPGADTKPSGGTSESGKPDEPHDSHDGERGLETKSTSPAENISKHTTEGGKPPRDSEAAITPDKMDADMWESLTLSDEELEALVEAVSAYTRESRAEERASVREDLVDLNLPVGNGLDNVCKNARCQHIRVTTASKNAPELYNKIVSPLRPSIDRLASQLKRIIMNRREDTVYKQSGKISPKRLNCGRATSRVFTKKRLPETSDLSVAIALDMSGSMSGQKIQVARDASIALAEVFAKLRIPLYIFGFTGDINGYKANHFHFVNWSNTFENRLSLLNVSAKSENFDGYAIRYGTELLRKRDSEKKLLIVISDGMPSCSAYGYNREIGMKDVKLAVTEANRVATTIGILLGDLPPEHHRAMYGVNFVHCKNVTELLPTLGKLLTKYF